MTSIERAKQLLESSEYGNGYVSMAHAAIAQAEAAERQAEALGVIASKIDIFIDSRIEESLVRERIATALEKLAGCATRDWDGAEILKVWLTKVSS